MPFIARAFETISMAKVSTSGPEAVKLGYLRDTDKMTTNRDFLIQDAKKHGIGHEPGRLYPTSTQKPKSGWPEKHLWLFLNMHCGP